MLESLWIEGFWNLAKKKEKKKRSLSDNQREGSQLFSKQKTTEH